MHPRGGGHNAVSVNRRFLSDNLAALQQSGCPVPVARLSTADDGEVVLKDGEVVDVQVRTPDGLVRLDPGVRPVDDAARTLPPAAMTATLVTVVGAGAGYGVEALIARGYTGRIVVLEPSLVSYLAALSRRDWSPLIKAGRLRWLAGPDYDGWLDTWSWVTPGQAPAVAIHPVLGRARATDVRSALETLKKMVFNASANERARLQFGGRYLQHTLANLPHLLASRDVGELFGRCSGTPVVVLAAGPSLDVNLEQLRPVRERALMIAVDTALRPCLAAGLPPDLVVGVDPGEANLRHLAVGTVPATTSLVAEASLAPGSFEAFDGRVFTFRVGDHHPWPWLNGQGIERAQLRAWGSVLASALDLAVQIGGNPVVLLGADFAYTGGQPYCRNTAYEEDWARDRAAGYSLEVIWRQWIKNPIDVADTAGRPVQTTPHLVAFRDWIANYCRAAAGVSFVNGTGAGLLGSVPQMPVGELLAGYPDVDRQALLAARSDRRSDRLPESLEWWDGSTPPQPWTSWLAAVETPLGDLAAASVDVVPADAIAGVVRAMGVAGPSTDNEARARAVATYWNDVKAASPTAQIAAARRLVLGRPDCGSEAFYSAICVLLQRGDIEMATACLTEVLRSDFAGTFHLLLPLLAHARQRGGDIRTAHLLFAASERLQLLSGRNAWAREAALQVALARGLQLSATSMHGVSPRAEYEAFVAAVRAGMDGSSSGRARRPDFIVAGAGGCGALLLYDFLCTSSSVWARRPKELHFFSRLSELGLPFYDRFFEACPADLRCGEISPSYLDESNVELVQTDEPDPAAAIAEACPATRVVVILKDPAARAISLYETEAAAPDVTLEGLRRRHGDRPLVTGQFVVPLRRFVLELGRERVLVMTTADLMDPAALAGTLGEFLDIDRPAPSGLSIADRDMVVAQPRESVLYRELREYFTPSLRALEDEFGIVL